MNWAPTWWTTPPPAGHGGSPRCNRYRTGTQLLGDGAGWAQRPSTAGSSGPLGICCPTIGVHSPLGLSRALFLHMRRVRGCTGSSHWGHWCNLHGIPVCIPADVPAPQGPSMGSALALSHVELGALPREVFPPHSKGPVPAASFLAAAGQGGMSRQVPGHQTLGHTAPLGGHGSSRAYLPSSGGPGATSCSVRSPRGPGSRGTIQTSVGHAGVLA